MTVVAFLIETTCVLMYFLIYTGNHSAILITIGLVRIGTFRWNRCFWLFDLIVDAMILFTVSIITTFIIIIIAFNVFNYLALVQDTFFMIIGVAFVIICTLDIIQVDALTVFSTELEGIAISFIKTAARTQTSSCIWVTALVLRTDFILAEINFDSWHTCRIIACEFNRVTSILAFGLRHESINTSDQG